MGECYGIIYKATNKINGKLYIGQTVQSLDKRIKAHINKALNNEDNMYFHKAIRKYGKENFIWEIIAKCNLLAELDRIEVEMIKEYNTFENGYNLTKGGNGNTGFKHTRKTKKKMSESRKGEKHYNYGKRHDEKIKKKISESLKGEKCFWYSKPRTEETRRKISEAQKGEKHYNYGRRGSRNPTAKKYIIITPECEKIFIHGLLDFCKNYKKEKLDHGHLVEVAQKRRKHHKGYKCRYWEEEKCNTILSETGH